MAWPEMPGCLLRLRYAQVSADSADLDELPDWSPHAGQTGTLKPSIRELVVYDPQGAKIVVELGTVQVEVDADGWLCKRTGEGALIPLRVAPTDDPLMSVTGWRWTLTLGSRTIGPFPSPSSGVVELADYVTAPATDNTKTWVERIPELVALIGAAAGTSSGVTADDTPSAPAEGQTASYLVTSAVVWPAGLVWSTDPDGGTAPTITGTALVSMFTLGGVTRAIMGATFPSVVVPDTTAPVAGTLADSAITSSGFTLTVTGATDETALHATPYAFSTDNGVTYSAWQASSVYAASGLTAGTTYTCIHKVRDAAANEATGSAIMVGTTAAAITFSTDFSAYSTGAVPAAFQQQWVSTTDSIVDIGGGEKVLRSVNEASSVRGVLAYEPMGSVNDAEVLVKFRTSSDSGTRHIVRLRVSGTSGSESGYSITNTSSKTRLFGVAKHVGGTFTELGDRIPHEMLKDTWYWVRFRAQGTTLQARIWADGESEPGTWLTTVTDSDLTAGKVGPATGWGPATTDFGYFSCGRGGKSAP